MPSRYSVTDGQPVLQDCVRVTPKDVHTVNIFVGRKNSAKPGLAFRDGISSNQWLLLSEIWDSANNGGGFSSTNMNFVFEGQATFTFSTGQVLSQVLRFGQTQTWAGNSWNITGPSCRKMSRNCLKCDTLCFQVNVERWQMMHNYIFKVEPCLGASTCSR